MTKDEAKKLVLELLSKVWELKDATEDLAAEVDDTYNEIEPYEGRDELTTDHDERKEWWFIELGRQLKEALTILDTIDNNLGDMTCCQTPLMSL